jgi:hypothetical protein
MGSPARPSRLFDIDVSPHHFQGESIMNTLSRALTARLFPNAEAYLALRRQWSTLINSDRKHALTVTHHLLYLAACGKDWRKAFTPATNRRKLDNGAYAGWILWRALDQLHWSRDEAALLAPFEGTITAEMLQHIRTLLPKSGPYAYQPDQFAAQPWPFEAYIVPAETLAN